MGARNQHENLALIRKDRGMSQVQLAASASVGLSSVQRLEQGDPRIGWGVASKVAAALDVDPTAFYAGDDLPAHLRATGSGAPEWAVRYHDEIMERLNEHDARLMRIEKCLSEEAVTVKALEEQVIAYIRCHSN
jgi:transcriptional regulator with XRE-family HTH domain